MLITNTKYTEITGAPAPANFESVQADVIARLEDLLNRSLMLSERTERVTSNYDGLFYPSATPIVDVDGDYLFDDQAVQVGRPSVRSFSFSNIHGLTPEFLTYSGGYTVETLPAGLAHAIAWGINTVTATAAGAILGSPSGVSSLSIAGEYSVTFAEGMTAGADGQPMPIRFAHMFDLGGRCVMSALRYRRVPV